MKENFNLTEDNTHDFTYEFLMVFDGKVSTESMRTYVEQCVGYAATVSDVRLERDCERPEFEWINDSTLFVYLDTTKGNGYGNGASFFPMIRDLLVNGSPLRVRKPGRLIEPQGFTHKFLAFTDDECLDVFRDSTLPMKEQLLLIANPVLPYDPHKDEPVEETPNTPEVGKFITIQVPEGAKKVNVTFEF